MPASGSGASAHGGTIVVDGDASTRAAISLKGGTVLVAGDVGNFSAFMAQAGVLLVGGDAGEALGDSLYEAVVYVAGAIKSLGSDAQVEDLTAQDVSRVRDLVDLAGFGHVSPEDVTRVGIVAAALQLRRRQGAPLLTWSPAWRLPESTCALRESHSFPRHVIDQIHGMAEEGRYEIRGWGAKRALPTFDDLVFVTASASRYPIEGYRETCSTTDGARLPVRVASRSCSTSRSRSPG